MLSIRSRVRKSDETFNERCERGILRLMVIVKSEERREKREERNEKMREKSVRIRGSTMSTVNRW